MNVAVVVVSISLLLDASSTALQAAAPLPGPNPSHLLVFLFREVKFKGSFRHLNLQMVHRSNPFSCFIYSYSVAECVAWLNAIIAPVSPQSALKSQPITTIQANTQQLVRLHTLRALGDKG